MGTPPLSGLGHSASFQHTSLSAHPAHILTAASLPEAVLCPPVSPYLHKTIQSALIELHTAHYRSLVHHPCPHHIHRVGGNCPCQPTCKTGTRYTRTLERNSSEYGQSGSDKPGHKHRSTFQFHERHLAVSCPVCSHPEPIAH